MTKVISLSNEAYERMKSVKGSGESFSDVVIKLIGRTKKKPLSDFLGRWSGSETEIENIKKTITEDRKKFRTREVVF